MSDGSKIEWTDATWNPVTGCDRVSPGCDNCYALVGAKRWKAMGNPRYQTDGDPRTSGPGFGVALHHDKLDDPLRWTKPRRVFVNSTSDLFHPRVPDGFIGSVFRTMALAPQHQFQVLTKRPRRMRALLTEWDGAWRDHRGTWQEPAVWPLPNVWLGVSVEDQQRAEERMPPLVATPAVVRFVSAEPLLGPVDLDPWLWERWNEPHGPGLAEPMAAPTDQVHWVIIGGESGPGARRMDPDWSAALVRQCVEADVAVFVKQLGSVLAREYGLTHPKGGNPDEWPWPGALRQRRFPDRGTVPA